LRKITTVNREMMISIDSFDRTVIISPSIEELNEIETITM
jgi:hypothetical protein